MTGMPLQEVGGQPETAFWSADSNTRNDPAILDESDIPVVDIATVGKLGPDDVAATVDVVPDTVDPAPDFSATVEVDFSVAVETSLVNRESAAFDRVDLRQRGAMLGQAAGHAEDAFRSVVAALLRLDAAGLVPGETMATIVELVGGMADALRHLADDFGHAEVERRAARNAASRGDAPGGAVS